MKRSRPAVSRLRQVGLVLSGTVAIASLAVYVFLRTERPLHFTDGETFVEGVDWRQAPRVVWDRPIPEVEVPGPVRGRITELPSGELIYGRVLADGTSDLVRFDPALPGEEPIPLVALNSRFQDFAPTLGPDGSLWFTSDRVGGQGGFDLWRAEARGLGRFGRPEPVQAPWNTDGDEVDPAFSPSGDRIVFARRAAGERTTLLFTAEVADSVLRVPSLVFDFSPELGEVRLERDPAFSHDGVTLHFSRSKDRSLPILMRSWRHRSEFSEPIPTQFGSSPSVSMRSPWPRGDGSIAVLPTGEDERPMLQVAEQRLAHPWWKAQQDLERMLLAIFAGALLIFILLLLGARWKRLDIVTWCLLLSLLVHLLLWLYVEGVQILDEDRNDALGDDEWSMEVAVYDGAAEGVASDRPDGPRDSASSVAVERRSRLEGFETDAPDAGELAAVESTARESARSDIAEAMAVRSEGVVEFDQADVELSEPTVSAEIVADANLGAGVETFEAGETSPLQAAADDASRRAPTTSQLQVSAPSSTALSRVSAAPRRSGVTSDPSSFAPSASESLTGPAEAVAVPVLQGSTVRGSIVADAELESRSVEGLAPVGPSEVAVGLEPEAPTPTPIAVNAGEPRNAPGTGLRRASASRPRAARGPETTLPTAGRVANLDRSTPRPRLSEPRRLPSVAEASVDGQGNAVDAATDAEVGRRTIDDLLGQADLEPIERAEDRPSAVVPGRRSTAENSAIAANRPELQSSLRRPMTRSSTRRRSADGRPQTALDRRPTRRGTVDRQQPALRTGERVADLERANPTEPRDASSERNPRRGTADAIARALRAETQASELPEAARPVRRGPSPSESRQGESEPLAVASAPRSRVSRLGRSTIDRTGPAEAIASLYSNRFGPRKDEALRRFGGSAETEEAVRDGLRYLASLQRRNGLWGTGHRDRKYGETEVGRSALCVLAFLGAGHTQISGTEHSAVVASALEALLRVQDEQTGHFGRRTSSYSHGISTYALAECYAITKDDRLRPPLERAIAWIVERQDLSRNPRNHGGWGYFSPTLQAEDGYARSSVSAWMVMALESAQIGGLEVPDETLTWAKRFLRSMYDEQNGYFLYSREPSRLRSQWRTLPASSPAAAFCLLLLGEDPASQAINAAMEYTARRRPRRYAEADDNDFVLRADGNPYFWYYGTLASFMRGGEDWERWNSSLKEVLLSGQEEDGSFPPIGAYASYAGDSRRNAAFTTALCVLSLEVYYRYFTPLLSGR
ncbi:MAG: hypothetical protein AAF196_12295 [Planctomycetota bacterium]